MTRRVYLDHNASTPIHPEVVAEMTPYFDEMFGNPSSVHGFGRDAREGIDIARDRIARFVKVPADQIVFTSGGTESDNFGIKGLALARGRAWTCRSRRRSQGDPAGHHRDQCDARQQRGGDPPADRGDRTDRA